MNNTERFVLETVNNYPRKKVPQVIFKEYDNSTIKKAFRSLKEKGYIIKQKNLMDMRQKYIILTEEGKNAIKNKK